MLAIYIAELALSMAGSLSVYLRWHDQDHITLPALEASMGAMHSATIKKPNDLIRTLQDCSSDMVDRMCTACDVNTADACHLTALDYCIYKGDAERADLMVKNGARMDPVLLLRTKCKR
jgi:hypothetical protein